MPLSYIKSDYELEWIDGKLVESDTSFALYLNQLFDELENVVAPKNYHKYEDRIAKYCASEEDSIYKKGKFWVGDDYGWILESGSYHDINEENLILAIAGRVKAALNRKQKTFDEMEERHRLMLSELLRCFIYHRINA